MNLMKIASKREILTMLWRTYSKQKQAEADSGVDNLGDIETMRGWFRKCLDGTADDKAFRETFPEKYPIVVNPLICAKCRDQGMYFSERVPKLRKYRDGYVTVVVPGMLVCTCPAGTDKKLYVEDKRKKPVRAEEF